MNHHGESRLSGALFINLVASNAIIMTVVIKSEAKCTLKDDLEITKKIKDLATGIFGLTNKNEKSGIPTLMSLHKQKKKDTWLLDIEFAGMEKLGGTPDEVNENINKIGRNVLGEDNFECDKSLGNGTGEIVHGYETVITCNIKFPEPPPMESTGNYKYQGRELKKWNLLKNVKRIDIDWEKAISRSERVKDIIVTNEYGEGFKDSDIHAIRDDYYWTWCK